MRAALERHHVPGAVVAIVRRGEPAMVAGYGMAEVENRTAATAATPFRTASVSKLATATVVAELVAEGRLDARSDVNRYLDFTIPPREGRPVTLEQLLTHTAGFDDRYVGKSARDAASALSLCTYLKRALPPRLLPPGEVFLYSNYGFALAGYIAERTAGQPFAELARQRVFEPLGMRHSAFGPAKGEARPYEWTGAGFRPLLRDYLQDAPAGMQASSAEDMAAFLAWVLEHPERAELQPRFRQQERLEGAIGWGWELGRSNGRGYAGHDGGYPGVVARLRVFSKDGMGYFVAANALQGAFLAEVSEAIERLLPAAGTEVAAARPAHWDRDVERYAGVYRDVRYSHDTLMKVGVLLGFVGYELRIGLGPEGVITMPRLDGSPRRLAQIGADVFQSLDDDYTCAFRRDAGGRVTHLFTSGTSALERVPWGLSAPVQRALFPVLVMGLVVLMVGPWRRRLLPEGARAAAGWAANLFAAQLLALGVGLQVLPAEAERMGGYMYGLTWPVWVAQACGVCALAAAAWLWVEMARRRPAPVWAWMAAVVPVVYAAWLWEWGLLGFRGLM